jgi:excisionase family DNA binding protein
MAQIITVRELSSYLRVGCWPIYRWVERNAIPFIRRQGLGIRFQREAVNEWLNRSASKPSAFLESALISNVALENYDKLFLKGGVKMSPKGKTWNYPFGSVYLRLTKSGKDRWYIYYRTEGKRIRKAIKGAQSRADALKVLQVEIAAAFRGKHGFKREGKKIRFMEFADLYIESYAKVNKRSWRDNLYSIGTFKPCFGNSWLHEISTLDIESFKAARLKEGVSKSRINRILDVLKKMLNLAVDWEYLPESPARKVKRFPGSNLKERIFGEDEKRRLLEACAFHLRPIVITGLYTAMRKAEILSLKWGQVDLGKRTIRVERTKSGKPRIILINSVLLDELSRLKQANGKSEHVFLDPANDKPLKDVKTAFRSACRRAGIRGVRFHDLRHTAASRMVEAGVDLVTVSKILGHSTIQMNMRYAHPIPENMRRAVETLVQNVTSAQDFVPAPSPKEESVPANALVSAN